MGQPFECWHELEQTYQYAHKFCPKLFGAPYSEAVKVLEAVGTKQGERVDLCTVHKSSQHERASQNRLSRRSQIWLDRLASDHPALFEKVQRGELRIKTAAREAQIIKDPTPLQLTQRAWKHATLDDKRLIVSWIQDRLRDDPASTEPTWLTLCCTRPYRSPKSYSLTRDRLSTPTPRGDSVALDR